MIVYNITLLIILCICIIIIYNKYSPNIDIIYSKGKYTVLLWYNRWYWSGECKRIYIKLFEV